MALLEDDELYLKGKGFVYETFAQTNGALFLVIRDYIIPANLFPNKADLLVKIPPLYPQSQMDMFWLNPDVRLVANRQYPNAANVFEKYLDENWQRFSRHYSTEAWRPNVDSLANHLIYVERCLEQAV